MSKLELNRENLRKILKTDNGKRQMQENLRNLQKSAGWEFVLAVLKTWIEDYQYELDDIDKYFKEGVLEKIRVKKVLLERLLNIPEKYIESLENRVSDISDNVGDPYE